MGRLHERFTSAKYSKAAFLLIFILTVGFSVCACGEVSGTDTDSMAEIEEEGQTLSEEDAKEVLSVEETVASYESELTEIPAYTGDAYVAINDNNPFFTKSNLPTESFEYYSELDELGRCGVACANIGQDIMPTEERGEIGQIKPSGWQTVKYDTVDGKYLYNRCHLIGYQLSAENANEKNLITGTRYLNVEGMLPFENMVADYVKETGNHVLYRVEPFFEGDNLLASGVSMEGWSVEDDGEGVCFNVFVFNVQPDIVIDYATGGSYLDEGISAAAEPAPAEESEDNTESGEPEESGDNAESDEALTKEAAEQSVPAPAGADYILNTNTHKFHVPSCGSVKQMSEENKKAYSGSRDDVIAMGYDPCKKCNP